jgi:hypothetical protein
MQDFCLQGEQLQNTQSSFEDFLYAPRMKSWDFIKAKSADRTHVWGHFERIRKPKSSFEFSIPHKQKWDNNIIQINVGTKMGPKTKQ